MLLLTPSEKSGFGHGEVMIMILKGAVFTCEELRFGAEMKWVESHSLHVFLQAELCVVTSSAFSLLFSVRLCVYGVCLHACVQAARQQSSLWSQTGGQTERGVYVWLNVFWSALLIKVMCHGDWRNIRAFISTDSAVKDGDVGTGGDYSV